MTRFNDWLALHGTALFSTMWCFYAFTVLALLPLPFPQTMAVVQFLSSGA